MNDDYADFLRDEAEGVARRDRELAEDEKRHEMMELERDMIGDSENAKG